MPPYFQGCGNSHHVFQWLTNDFRGQFPPEEYNQESIESSIKIEIEFGKSFIQKIINGLKSVSEAKCKALVENHVRYLDFDYLLTCLLR